MTNTDWFKNDALFRRELEVGHKWAAIVADRLNEEGVPAELTPLAWRDSIDDRHQFSNETDITILTHHGLLGIESKSRNLHFTDDPLTYPYSTAFVDTVSGWDRKTVKPIAVVFTSQKTRQMLALPSKSSNVWTTEYTFDRVRKIYDWWYEAPSSTLLPFQVLVESLRKRLDP